MADMCTGTVRSVLRTAWLRLWYKLRRSIWLWCYSTRHNLRAIASRHAS